MPGWIALAASFVEKPDAPFSLVDKDLQQARGGCALALIWLIAVFAIAFGILMVGFAFKVKNFKKARTNQGIRE